MFSFCLSTYFPHSAGACFISFGKLDIADSCTFLKVFLKSYLWLLAQNLAYGTSFVLWQYFLFFFFLVELTHLTYCAVPFFLIFCSIFVWILCCLLLNYFSSLNRVGSWRRAIFRRFGLCLCPNWSLHQQKFLPIVGYSLSGRVIWLWIVGVFASFQKAVIKRRWLPTQGLSFLKKKLFPDFLSPLALPKA